MELFGERLRRLRLAGRFTQSALGERIGVSDGAITDLEKGDRQPAMNELIALARTLRVSLDYLIVGHETGLGGAEGPEVIVKVTRTLWPGGQPATVVDVNREFSVRLRLSEEEEKSMGTDTVAHFRAKRTMNSFRLISRLAEYP